MSLLGILAWAAALAVHAGPIHLWAFLILLAATFVAARYEIELANVSFAGDFIPLAVCVIIAPTLAPLCALASLTLAYSSRSARILSTLNIMCAASCASLVAAVTSTPTTFSQITTVVAAAGVTLVAANILGVLAILTSMRRARATEVIPALIGSLLSNSIFLLPLVTFTIWGWSEMGLAALPMIVVPMTLAQYFLALYHRKVQLTGELAEKAQILARTNLQFAAAMVKALDQRDAYTAGHSAAVAVYTRDIAREMGFDDEVIRLAHLSGLLHDIGKIGVPGRVLNKTAPLDDEEYELMKSHAAMGAEILGEVDLYADIAVLVRYHHERVDGRGYPDGIAGEAIPAISRMISVADTYSAMTTDRPYRDGMPTEKAMSILRECRGTQLDADFTDAFLRILIIADEDYQRGKQTEFEVEVAKHQALSEVEAEAVRIHAPQPAGPVPAPAEPVLPAAVDGELVEVELEREAA